MGLELSWPFYVIVRGLWCILGLYFTFSGVNSGFNGVGVTLLGYRLEMGIWAVYCVVLHRILGWLVGWLLLRWMQQGKGIRVGLHNISETLVWERGYLFISHATLKIWHRTNRPKLYSFFMQIIDQESSANMQICTWNFFKPHFPCAKIHIN